MKRIAIIGAGVAGLTLANRLSSYGAVEVFEKSRGVGGRTSTRYHDPFTFDHGAQFFTARDKRFTAFLAPLLDSGLIQEWKGKVVTLEPGRSVTDRLWFEPHYVSCPGMNSLCKHLAESVKVHVNCEIEPLGERTAIGWNLCDKSGQLVGAYDLVISTAPPIQTCRLFDAFLAQDSYLRRSKMLACYTMMYGFKNKWDQSWIAAKINNSPLDWIAVNSTKPGRDNHFTTLVVHSNNSWAEEHADDDLQQAELFLRARLSDILPLPLDEPSYFSLHRWRYALLNKAHDDDTRIAPFYDKALQLASVGDWGSRSRIEDVWLEAHALAEKILA